MQLAEYMCKCFLVIFSLSLSVFLAGSGLLLEPFMDQSIGSWINRSINQSIKKFRGTVEDLLRILKSAMFFGTSDTKLCFLALGVL